MTVITKPIGRLPINKGNWDANFVNPKTGIAGYGKKFRAIRYGCELESKIENNTYDPITWDGSDTFNIDETHWLLVSGNPQNWLAGQNKPATSEQYPFNGMGRIRLQKNLVEVEEGGETVTKNLLTQVMFEDGDDNPLTDTIYVIQYDFDLDGAEITIPENCVLEFDGGSLKNGTLTGTDTQIKAQKTAIFAGITIAGTWNVPYITSDWFGDATTRDDVIKSVFNLASDTIYNEIIIEEGNYWASRDEETGDVLLAKSNTRYIINGNIRTRPSSQNYTRTIYIYEKENVTIEGSGCIYGDKLTHIYYDGNSYPDGYIPGFIFAYGHNPTITPPNPEGYSSHEYCHGIEMRSCNNILIKDLSIYDCVGDCLNIKFSKYVTVKNVHLENARRQGCSMSGSNILFEDVTIKNIKGTAPESGIDIETSSDEIVVMSENIVLRNMSIQGVSCGIIATGQHDNYNKILIQNVHVTEASRGLSVHNYANKVLVENSSFDLTIRGSKVYPERMLQGLLLSQVHLRDCYINVNVPYIKPGFDPSDESKVIHFEDYLTYDISETEETEEEIRELYYAIEIETIDAAIDGCVINSNVGSVKGNARLFISNNHISGGNIDCGSSEGIFIVGNRFDLVNGKVKGSRIFITGNDFNSCALIEGANMSIVGNIIRFDNPIDTVLFKLSNHARVIGNRIITASELEIDSICNLTTGIFAGNLITGFNDSVVVLPTGGSGWAYDNYTDNALLQETYNRQKRTGTTSNRPTVTQEGYQFFDTTLNKPIYWNGTDWVDATGTTV